MRFLGIACVLVVACLHQARCKTESQLKKDILDQILPKNENEVFAKPDGVTVVETSLHVLDVESLNEKNMEFTVTMYFRQGWKDQRLKYVATDRFDFVTMNDADAIWTPDTFFVNQKSGHDFDLVRPNVFIRIYPDGSVLCSKKLSVTLACPMDFSRFPFDEQQCNMRMESYGSTADAVLMKWKDSAISVGNDLSLSLFQLEKLVSSSGSVRLQSGEYSFLSVNFYFSRQLGYYVHQIYLPSILMVAVSWLPFWLKKEALVARLLITVGLLMTHTTVALRFHAKQPRVSYATSLLYFTWMCTTFLVVSLLETILLHILSDGDGTDGKVKKSSRKVKIIVTGSRFFVPLVFLLLSVVYFGTAGGCASNLPIEVPGNKTNEIIINSW